MEQNLFDAFLRSIPSDVDVDSIRQEWCALKPQYVVGARRLPLPVWARRQFTENGISAWDILRHDVPQIPITRPFCIYIHIPFCASKCDFCDCYSFRLGQHQSRHIEAYVNLQFQEMRQWSSLGSLAKRPVSTVHLGGGTPTFIGTTAFRQLVENCRENFAIGPQTELALESTTSELTDEMFDTLQALGFTRLHIGVQSLDDSVRMRINRRESSSQVLEKISRAVMRDWIVSVDLIYGLPGQSLNNLLSDIQQLTDVGIDGVSLYELQLSAHNRKFAERHGLDREKRVINYFFFQAASCRLALLGYAKTLFNHFARARDTNLYFTFPIRGEDCLALGTIADGVFGDYHYRHPVYQDYCRSMSAVFPGLQGGLRRNALENRVHPLEISLLSGTMSPGLFEQILGKERTADLNREWHDSALITEADEHWRLTANGSWFAGEMMAQLLTLWDC